ncbi:M60 family metallopeptidase [Nonomuraea sp. NPDC050404]|uniref:M60 family metallopeptidase n=1 Tax=Nonomuraea sp. NPDC050404 TaxID=3155783 RepID=UPI0033E38017
MGLGGGGPGGRPSRLLGQDAYTKAATYLHQLHEQAEAGAPAEAEAVRSAGAWNDLVMLHQIGLTLGRHGWTALLRLVRDAPHTPPPVQDDAATWRATIALMSRAFGHDLRDHFTHWGMSHTYTPDFHQHMDALNLPRPEPAPATCHE